jgi:hypothetical protein
MKKGGGEPPFSRPVARRGDGANAAAILRPEGTSYHSFIASCPCSAAGKTSAGMGAPKR